MERSLAQLVFWLGFKVTDGHLSFGDGFGRLVSANGEGPPPEHDQASLGTGAI